MVMMSAAPAMAESSNAFDDDLMMRLNALDSGPMKRSASPVFEEMCAMNVVEECDMMVAKSAMVMKSRAPQKRMMRGAVMKEQEEKDSSEDEDDDDSEQEQEEMKESESLQMAAVNELAMAQAEAAPV